MNTKGQPRLRYLFNQIGWTLRKYDPGHARHRKTGLPSVSTDPMKHLAIATLSILFATMFIILATIIRIHS